MPPSKRMIRILLISFVLVLSEIPRSGGFSAAPSARFTTRKLVENNHYRLCGENCVAPAGPSSSRLRDLYPILKLSDDETNENQNKVNGKKRTGFINSRLIVLTAFAILGLLTALISPRAVAASAVASIPLDTAATAVVPTPPPVIVGPFGCHGALSRKTELQLSFRLAYASLVGSIVGWERSASNHSAGVRTMSLVSLGAAAFTVCSMYGFFGCGARFDPSRMASSVASGVGFIGAGVITTHNMQQRKEKERSSQKSIIPRSVVHGLTTAAAIWISAAVGVASGVGMYYIAGTASAATVLILRFGRVKETPWGKRIMCRHVGMSGRVPRLKTRKASSSLENDSMPQLDTTTHDLTTWDEKPKPTLDPLVEKFHNSMENQTTSLLPHVANVTDILWTHKDTNQEEDQEETIIKLETIVEDFKQQIRNQTSSAPVVPEEERRIR